MFRLLLKAGSKRVVFIQHWWASKNGAQQVILGLHRKLVLLIQPGYDGYTIIYTAVKSMAHKAGGTRLGTSYGF